MFSLGTTFLLIVLCCYHKPIQKEVDPTYTTPPFWTTVDCCGAIFCLELAVLTRNCIVGSIPGQSVKTSGFLVIR